MRFCQIHLLVGQIRHGKLERLAILLLCTLRNISYNNWQPAAWPFPVIFTGARKTFSGISHSTAAKDMYLSWSYSLPSINFECCRLTLPYHILISKNIYAPSQQGGDILVSVRIPGVGVGMTDSCMHDISWTNGWNITKLAWIYHWDKLKDLCPCW